MFYKKVCNYRARRRQGRQSQAKHDAEWRPILSLHPRLFSLENRAGEIPMLYNNAGFFQGGFQVPNVKNTEKIFKLLSSQNYDLE